MEGLKSFILDKIIAIRFLEKGDLMKTAVKRMASVFSAFLLVYFIYIISIILFKSGFDAASRDFFFITLSAYLLVPSLKYIKMKNDILDDNLEENERIFYEGKQLFENADILEGALLKYEDDEFKVENLIITKKGIFNIVKCNYTGRIKIKDNRWYRVYTKSLSEIPSPISEVRKNRSFLSKIYDEDQIVDVIVMVKDRVFIRGEEFSDVPVIRYSDLCSFIESYEGDLEWDKESLYDKIYKRIIKVNNLLEEEKKYNEFLDNKWSMRSRLSFISAFLILYIIQAVNI